MEGGGKPLSGRMGGGVDGKAAVLSEAELDAIAADAKTAADKLDELRAARAAAAGTLRGYAK
eukprot:236335-Prymnesium_polylepis.1